MTAGSSHRRQSLRTGRQVPELPAIYRVALGKDFPVLSTQNGSKQGYPSFLLTATLLSESKPILSVQRPANTKSRIAAGLGLVGLKTRVWILGLTQSAEEVQIFHLHRGATSRSRALVPVPLDGTRNIGSLVGTASNEQYPVRTSSLALQFPHTKQISFPNEQAVGGGLPAPELHPVDRVFSGRRRRFLWFSSRRKSRPAASCPEFFASPDRCISYATVYLSTTVPGPIHPYKSSIPLQGSPRPSRQSVVSMVQARNPRQITAAHAAKCAGGRALRELAVQRASMGLTEKVRYFLSSKGRRDGQKSGDRAKGLESIVILRADLRSSSHGSSKPMRISSSIGRSMSMLLSVGLLSEYIFGILTVCVQFASVSPVSRSFSASQSSILSSGNDVPECQ
ncbi:hypothetical protein C8F01DRAFT_1091262 [Mycena amicta]|nr:hypothetical protein C8F01DRAFT_1091262 [Mycena amicta]